MAAIDEIRSKVALKTVKDLSADYFVGILEKKGDSEVARRYHRFFKKKLLSKLRKSV